MLSQEQTLPKHGPTFLPVQVGKHLIPAEDVPHNTSVQSYWQPWARQVGSWAGQCATMIECGGCIRMQTGIERKDGRGPRPHHQMRWQMGMSSAPEISAGTALGTLATRPQRARSQLQRRQMACLVLWCLQ